MRASVAILAAAVLFSGCLVPAPRAPTGPDAADASDAVYKADELSASFNRTTDRIFDLAGLAEHGPLVRLEIVPEGDDPVDITVHWDEGLGKPGSSEKPTLCMHANLEQYMATYISSGHVAYFRDPSVGRYHVARPVNPLSVEFAFTFAEVGPGGARPFYALVGLSDVARWQEAGGVFDIAVAGGDAVWWRVHEAGSLSCGVVPYDFADDTSLVVPGVTQVEEAEAVLDLPAGATLDVAWRGDAFDVGLEGPSGMIFSDSGSGEGHDTTAPTEEGPHRLWFDRLEGTDAFGYYRLDSIPLLPPGTVRPSA